MLFARGRFKRSRDSTTKNLSYRNSMSNRKDLSHSSYHWHISLSERSSESNIHVQTHNRDSGQQQEARALSATILPTKAGYLEVMIASDKAAFLSS